MKKLSSASVYALCLSFFLPSAASAYTTNYSVQSGNIKRSAVIHIPDQILEQKTKAPVVYAFHGQGSAASTMEGRTALVDAADKDGFIVVFPDGVHREGYPGRYWNVAPFELDTVEGTLLSDRGLIEKTLGQLDADGVVDHSRISAVGFSMGGIMAYKLACEMPDVFSAIAVVAGVDTSSNCVQGLPVSIFQIHGFQDNRIPFSGGQVTPGVGPEWPSVSAKINEWKGRQQCVSEATYVSESNVTCVRSTCGGGAVVESCLAFNGGHAWMGKDNRKSFKVNFGDEQSSQFDLTGKIVDFLMAAPARYVAPIEAVVETQFLDSDAMTEFTMP